MDRVGLTSMKSTFITPIVDGCGLVKLCQKCMGIAQATMHRPGELSMVGLRYYLYIIPCG